MPSLRLGHDFELRDAGPDDLPFVRSTWLRDFKEHSQLARRIDDAEYAALHRVLVDRAMARGRVVVAADREAPAVLWGWAAWEPGTLHYVFVKRPFRGLRLGTALLDSASLPEDFFYTHATYAWDGVVRAKYRKARFSPYRL